ncbi:MAG: DNA methyltransferase [Chloroflexi bacterium]|nr:DNA methyltransferase [Chloroflexota bacterium]
MAFGVFLDSRLMGALTIGCGPSQAYRLVGGARPDDCAVLTRLWLSDDLPTNSESRVIGVVSRALRRNTSLKFLLSYADPSVGHLGTIYQAAGWVYTGLSQATPLYDIGDGKVRHSRSLSHAYGSHSVKHFRRNGVDIKTLPQARKHRYIYFLDNSYRRHLNVPDLPYPKKGG